MPPRPISSRISYWPICQAVGTAARLHFASGYRCFPAHRPQTSRFAQPHFGRALRPCERRHAISGRQRTRPARSQHPPNNATAAPPDRAARPAPSIRSNSSTAASSRAGNAKLAGSFMAVSGVERIQRHCQFTDWPARSRRSVKLARPENIPRFTPLFKLLKLPAMTDILSMRAG